MVPHVPTMQHLQGIQRRSLGYRRPERQADCNFAIPKSREMPLAPYFCRYYLPFLLSPPDCRPGRFALSAPSLATEGFMSLLRDSH